MRIKGLKLRMRGKSPIVSAVVSIGASILALAFTFKNAREIEDDIDETRCYMEEAESKEEKKKIFWQGFGRVAKKALPIAVCFVISTVFSVYGAVSSTAEINRLTTALAGADLSMKAMADKIKEVVPQKKAKEIQESVIEKEARYKLGNEYCDEFGIESDGFVQAKGGSTAFYDRVTGRVFRSDVHTIQNVCNEMNTRLAAGEQYWTYNEFFNWLQLPGVIAGDHIGWGGFSQVQKLLPNMNCCIRLNNIPVIVLDWEEMPDRHIT